MSSANELPITDIQQTSFHIDIPMTQTYKSANSHGKCSANIFCGGETIIYKGVWINLQIKK